MTTAEATSAAEPTASDAKTAAQDLLPQPAAPAQAQSASAPVEMSSLPSQPAAAAASEQPDAPSQPAAAAPSDPHNTLTPVETAKDDPSDPAAPHGPARMDTAAALSASLDPPPSPPPPPPPAAVATSTRPNRSHSTAIGPSSDSPIVPAKDEPPAGPTLMITLLLTSGARHPFRLDSKYFAKRGVEAAGNDPFNLSVYKLKELILREWRDEWETKPSSPNYIRLISFGKLLDDKAPLKDYKLNVDSPNVLHMTIKPQDFVEEEDSKGGKGSYANNREGEQRSPGCRCVIM